MRKSSARTQNYRPATSRGPVSLITFREQMADYARAERLCELRAQTHHSREYVAAAIGVSTKSVYAWEKGGKIRWPNAQKIAAFYGVEAEELVSRDIPAETDGAPALDNGSQLDKIEAMLTEVLSILQTGGVREKVEKIDDRLRGVEKAVGALSDVLLTSPGAAQRGQGSTRAAAGRRRTG